MTETGDFSAHIRSIYNQFTRAEKRVADYVLEHHRDVLFMSITELSDVCGVGETSIFRFCRSIGLGGYQEFKIRLSLSMNGTDEEERLASNVQPGDDLPTLVRKVLASSQRALSETAALLNPADLDRAVTMMTAAKRVFFFGVGASLTAARKASDKFLRVEPKSQCHPDIHMQAMQAATMTPDDVAIVFSYSGSTKDTNTVASLAHKSGAKVVAITRFRKSPLTEFTDVILLSAANEGPLQSGSAEADICQSFLIDLLYTEYYNRNIQSCRANNEKTASSVQAKLY